MQFSRQKKSGRGKLNKMEPHNCLYFGNKVVLDSGNDFSLKNDDALIHGKLCELESDEENIRT